MSDLDLIYGIKPKTITASEMKEKKEGVHTRKELKVQDIKKVHKPASVLASNQDSMVETIRKTVKSLGKEVAFTRVTSEEKGRLTDIVYTYKRQSIKTSENEINRIAINFLIEDYTRNGKESVLAKVIEALNA